MLIKGKPFKRKALHKPTLSLHSVIVQNFYHLFMRDKITNKFRFIKKETRITYQNKGIPFIHPNYPYAENEISGKDKRTIRLGDEWRIFEKE